MSTTPRSRISASGRSATTTRASRARRTSSAWRSTASDRLVIGVGNPWRRDDGVGLAVARRVHAIVPQGVLTLEHDGEAASLLDAWATPASVVVAEAVLARAAPGTVVRADVSAAPLPSALASTSTHAIGVADAIELGRALGRLPARLIVVGVVGRDFGVGRGLSAAVAAAVGPAASAVLVELDALTPAG